MKTYSRDEAAEFLKVHPETILKLVATGELPGAMVGRALVFMQPLEDYLRNLVRKQTDERRALAAAVAADPTLSAMCRTGRRRRLPALPEARG